MKKFSRNAKLVILCILLVVVTVVVVILNQFLKHHNQETKEERQHYSQRIDGELRHEAVGLKSSDTIVDLTEEEVDQIFETLQIVIPEDETEITVRLFTKIDTQNVGSYYLELDGIKERDAFMSANCEIDDNLKEGLFWNRVDENGGYTHYFVFRVYYRSKFNPVENNEYVIKVGELYNELLATHSG